MQKGHTLSEHSKSKGFAPIFIVLVIVITAAIGGGVYYFSNQKAQKSETTPQPVTSTQVIPTQNVTPTEAVNDPPSSQREITWKTELVQIKKETAISGNENINLEIQLPTDWNLKTLSKTSNANNIIRNCSDYVLTSGDSTAILTISPVCDGWSAKYSDWPSSAVTIKEEKNVGVDGGSSYTVRYLESTTKQYKYVEGEKGISNKIMDAILIRYNPSTGNFLPVRILLSYSSTDNTSLLVITDKIITSLKAQ